jgi:hypothetical protein
MSFQPQTTSHRVFPKDRVDEATAVPSATAVALREFRNHLTAVAVAAEKLPAGALTRAAHLASPSALVVERAGTKDAAAALECLLAMLVLDLAQSRDAQAGQPGVSLRVETARGSLSIEVESEGVAPIHTGQAASWRLTLAHELAGKLGARILTNLEPAAYAVQLR